MSDVETKTEPNTVINYIRSIYHPDEDEKRLGFGEYYQRHVAPLHVNDLIKVAQVLFLDEHVQQLLKRGVLVTDISARHTEGFIPQKMVTPSLIASLVNNFKQFNFENYDGDIKFKCIDDASFVDSIDSDEIFESLFVSEHVKHDFKNHYFWFYIYDMPYTQLKTYLDNDASWLSRLKRWFS